MYSLPLSLPPFCPLKQILALRGMSMWLAPFSSLLGSAWGARCEASRGVTKWALAEQDRDAVVNGTVQKQQKAGSGKQKWVRR